MIPTGIIAAAVTPRRSGPEIDLAAAFELIDFLSSRRPAGIALMSLTGEFPHFTIEERSRLVSLAVKRSRVPVVAGVTHSTLDGSLALAKEAAYTGAAALLIMPPPAVFRYTQEEVREFLHNFADQLDDDVPVLIHNSPPYASDVAPETLADLLASGLFAGVVESCVAGIPPNCTQSCLTGDDSCYVAARLAGSSGAVSPAACVVPELMLALDKAILSDDAGKREQLESLLSEFLAQLAAFPDPYGIREALAVRGVNTGIPATPPGPRTLHRLSEFREWFKGWLPPVLKESTQ